jgi:hypothetical protein
MHTLHPPPLLLVLFLFPFGFAQAQTLLPPRILPACHAPKGDAKLKQWTDRLALTLPPKDANYQRGKVVDVDYVVDVLQRKSTKAFMSLWSGPTAFGPDAPRNLVEDSPSYSRRDFHDANGNTFGMESFGVTREGKHWRHTWIALSGMDGITYTVDSADDATFFDRIVDSLCVLPPGKNHH